MLNVYVRTQVKTSSGRIDMVVDMPDVIYIFELKKSGTSAKALEQINQKGYAIPFETDGRKIVKVGVTFDANTRTISDWQLA
jgi:hypothetical protein